MVAILQTGRQAAIAEVPPLDPPPPFEKEADVADDLTKHSRRSDKQRLDRTQ